ncbi:hypothetical protein GY45DRAFT_453302 [Cubamyces sp. BRFM 1775]|nr:hypothetical protein GY45DRAFT_453302 [Cubamyces sp. BRFM 1775]
MHRSPIGHSLQRWNEDILAEIFSHLQGEIIDGPPSGSSRATHAATAHRTPQSQQESQGRHRDDYELALNALARCARASKALHEPAVNALWHALHSISYLTGVLACSGHHEDVEQPHSEGGGGAHQQHTDTLILVPVEDISPTAFARFQYYARRIRRLRERNAPRAKVAGSAPSSEEGEGDSGETLFSWLRQLRDHFGGRPLLPNLIMLDWRLDPQTFNPLGLLPLISSSLRTLQLTAMRSTKSGLAISLLDPVKNALKNDPSRFLGELSAAAPNLEYLFLAGSMPHAILTGISDLTQLQSLDIFMLLDPFTRSYSFGTDHPVFHALAMLPKLQILKIKLSTNSAGSSNPSLSVHPVQRNAAHMEFPSLRDLCIASPPSLIPHVLARISSPAFRSISIQTADQAHWLDLHTSLNTVVKRFSATLRVICLSRLGGSSSQPAQADPAVRLGEIFAPLLEVRDLEVFYVDLGTNANVEDAPAFTLTEACDFARAWPRLRDLGLLCRCIPPGSSIELLTTLAKHCPALESLHLASLDLKNTAACELSSLPVSDHRLQQLYLGCNIPDRDSAYTTPVAQVMDRLFPYTNIRPLSGQKLALCERRDWHEFRKCFRKGRGADRSAS